MSTVCAEARLSCFYRILETTATFDISQSEIEPMSNDFGITYHSGEIMT